MNNNTKAIAKLKRNSRKWPTELGINGCKNWLLLKLPAFLVLWLLRNFLVESEYRLKRESMKFFRYSNIAYGARQIRRCDRLLKIALNLACRDKDLDYVALIRNAVQSTSKDSKKRSDFSGNLLADIRRLEISMFDASSWYQLSRGLFSLGYFRAAWVARENSLDLSISEGFLVNAGSNAQLRRLQAHFERMELKEMDKLRYSNLCKHLTHFENFRALIESTQINLSDVSDSRRSKSVDLFRELITAKTVAIVGPGSPQNDYGVEIDSFETVIRIKFIGNELLDASSYHGARTDISFIGAISAIKLQEKSLIKNIKKFQLILSNQTSVESIGSVPIYEIQDEGVIYRTPTTAGIRTLKEVIKYAPSKLKIYGFDFYSNLNPYSKEMTKFYEESSWRFGHPNDFVTSGVYSKFARARDFSEHDPVSNFCFAQNLYKAGLFDIEPYGKSILELTPFQYVERLEEMLGDW